MAHLRHVLKGTRLVQLCESFGLHHLNRDPFMQASNTYNLHLMFLAVTCAYTRLHISLISFLFCTYIPAIQEEAERPSGSSRNPS